jgi:hypothetical protein
MQNRRDLRQIGRLHMCRFDFFLLLLHSLNALDHRLKRLGVLFVNLLLDDVGH